MPIAQPYSVVTQGLGGGLYVTLGYAVGDIGITIDPVVGVTAALGTIVYTASVAASWSVTGGSIVAAGDNLSATWTAPAGVGTYTITGTELSNPGNIGHAYGVVQAAGIVGGSFTFTGGIGNLIDTARAGAYGVVASSGGGGSPVLLPDLVEYISVIGSVATGQHNGINITRSSGDPESYVDAAIAGGRALSFPDSETGPLMHSAADALLSDWGSVSDFLVVIIAKFSDPAIGGAASMGCGENNASGWDMTRTTPAQFSPRTVLFSVPDADEGYPSAYTGTVANGAWRAIRLKWDLSELTLSCTIDSGSPTNLPVPAGCGAPDPTNFLFLSQSNWLFGIMGIWRGTIPSDADIDWFINISGGNALGRTYADTIAYTGA